MDLKLLNSYIAPSIANKYITISTVMYRNLKNFIPYPLLTLIQRCREA